MQVDEREIREISHAMECAMTAKQLREALEDVDDDARVFFVCDYGDHHNTPQALPVGEHIADCSASDLHTTAYSQSGVAMIEEREPNDEPAPEWPEDEDFPVCFLRM